MRKKLLSYILITIVFLSQPLPSALGVFAQEAVVEPQITEATQSAQPEPTAIPSPSELSPTSTESPIESPTEIVLPTMPLSDLNTNTDFQTSAILGVPVKVQKLKKNTFKGDEKVTVIVEGAKTSGVSIRVYDVDGKEISVELEKVNSQDPAVLRINPPRQFKAGRYRLVVTDPSGNTTTQDFTWGVLALNPNKSIYLPNETANLAMAVLDETGMMVCDAKVELKIAQTEQNINDTLSTDNGKITVNPECNIKDFTEKPDYEASYQLKGAGVYDLTLTAVTKNGTYSISDSLEVRDSVPFDVERVNATRIFPPATYSSIYNITANEDFEGTITETVPDTFAITKIDGVLPFDQEATVSAQSAVEDSVKNEIPQLHLPYQGEFAISQKFGSEIRDPLVAQKYADYGLAGHDGIDFDLPAGEAVLAADDGEVVKAEENWDYGTTIVIQHSWGRSYYGHLSQMTAYVGKKVNKGWPLGLSGSTGLSSGPHLHFGIKPNKNDPNNGYYGKINPMPYLGLESFQSGRENIVFSSSQPESYSVKTLTWNVSVKKGDKIKLGYGYKVPNVSPQFYLLGPLQFKNNSGQMTFQETRQWQLAIDADGSGTNTVNPTSGTVSTTGNTYTFTFTPTENMDSGQIQIQVPSSGSPDWSTPQGSAGTAGYTTAVGNTAATVGTVLNSNDSATGWGNDDVDMCEVLALDTGTKIEGTGSILCDNNPQPTNNPDNNDSFGFDYGAAQDWSAYTQVSYWINRTSGTNGTLATFSWGSGTDLNATELGFCTVPSTPTSGAWVYAKCTLSGTLTSVRSYGFTCTGNNCNPFDAALVYIDELLIGPGLPTFSGRNINVRLLDATSTDTVTITYGSGGGTSGVQNSSTATSHQFTTLSKIAVNGTLAGISVQPSVSLSSAGPTMDQVMRHGKWFSSGSEAAFTF